ncbi:bifunctional 4-hydroxy-2-oxoglutarate aldolase/2-dehydro-3-deoxy-phosphogluconate aldolase [Lacticigenium naphthae]|uniref:bifunctional 4-hydroxy-2-oxoglutarate aldolase/2-dehydro-3-deoxy-phosphogluconate aldolase n=1 Tax=Lacticigenium naphthae TaxID=515351 RepID=UPI00041B4141|nr:bifunctional 4-hydroxy-2-oxoglutarate aldolase/2-dehydro-3-deoxy-phosphogluconate aldolase [Lacticigenium naphthae]
MTESNFPKVTIILRGYNFEQVNTVIQLLEEENKQEKYALEITLNSPDVFKTIKKISNKYGGKFHIGAGTVLNLEDTKRAIQSGAKFILSPIKLEKEVIKYCNNNNIIVVPAAMTPSEIVELKTNGADIIKVFPARTVGYKFFSDVQSPLGKLPLMAVGGITAENTYAFFENGASFVGIGSGIFNKEDIINQDIKNLKKSLNSFEEKNNINK